MKKLVALALTLVLILGCFGLFSCGEDKKGDAYKVAMVTDYGDITDQSFNQTTYEACKAFCEAQNIEFKYYKPASNDTAARVSSIESAIDEGFNVIVLPGYAFGEAIAKTSKNYKDVKFIALDVSKGDLLEKMIPNYDYNPDGHTYEEAGIYMDNVYCAVYQEELSGYMAGYAAVKLGYKKLGFLGGMEVPAVQRFGYGFIQGVEAAAKEMNLDGVEVKYVYGGQFYGDADIKARMDTWYKDGTEVVFACGGGIYVSAAEAATAEGVNGKIIGVDVDQKAIIDGKYGNGLTVTSAMKGLYPTTYDTLTDVIVNGKWDNYKGKIATLGLVSATDPTKNYVQIPMDSTQWADGKFTQEDYKGLVAKMFNKQITVSNDISAHPKVEKITVNYESNIK